MSSRPDIPETRTAPTSPPASSLALRTPARQLQDLPLDELRALAEEFGLDPKKLATPQDLVSAIHCRRQLIAGQDREALLDIVRWGRRPVPLNASKEQLAQEIFRIKSMRFDGLSQKGLLTLARLRGAQVSDTDDVPSLIKKLNKLEGLLGWFHRKRRAWLGSIVSGMFVSLNKLLDLY